jgi:actin-related protein 9
MAQLYAANALNGVVVDIGYDTTDVTSVYDGFVVSHARATTNIGSKDCQAYLAHLLKANQSVMSALSPPSALLSSEALDATFIELARYIWEQGHVKIHSSGEAASLEDEGVTDIAAVLVAGKEKAVIESGMKRKATAKASAAEQARAREIEAMDLITIQFRGQTLTVGKERHRFCEPLFDSNLLGETYGGDRERPLSLQETVGHAVSRNAFDHRHYIWSGLFVTGDPTQHVKG